MSSKIISSFLLAFWIFSVSYASNIKIFQNSIYESFITHDINRWERIVGEMVQEYNKSPSNELLYDIVLAYYGAIGYHLDFGEQSKAKKHLVNANKFVEKLIAKENYKAQALAFKSAFYGFEISINAFKGISLGPKSISAADKSVELNPNYTRGWIEKGNVRFHTPALLGGSKSDAIEFYTKAIEMYDAELPNNHKWLYLNTLISIARAHEFNGNIQKAVNSVIKAIDFEPRYKWAKEVYLPQLQKK